MSFNKASVQLEPCAETAAHAVVAGDVTELLQWLAGGRTGGLRFDGDTRLLDSLSGLMQGYQPDLAPPLGRVIGDDVASALVGFVEAAGAAARSALQTLGGAAEEAARERYASSDQLTDAIQLLEDLALKVDRLNARTDRLEDLRNTAAAGNPE
jgi:ubiquinone biosynthesis protein UbiJ